MRDYKSNTYVRRNEARDIWIMIVLMIITVVPTLLLANKVFWEHFGF